MNKISDKNYYPALDGIRGYLIILVIGFHLESKLGASQFNIKALFDGKSAVDVFFVISGFLITTMLLKEEEKCGRISLKAFYIRRIFRLLPVFIFTVIIYLLVGLIIPGQEIQITRTLNAIPYHFTMRSEYIPEGLDASIGHAWSLSVEEKFYLVWPALLFLCLKPSKRYLVYVTPLILAVFLYEYQLFYAYVSLLLGALFAQLMHQPERSKIKMKWINHLARPLSGYLLLALCLVTYFMTSFEGHPFKMLFVASVTLMLVHLVYGDSIAVKFLSNKVNVFMGKKAYAMYLLHMVFVNPVQNKLLDVNSNTMVFVAITISYIGVLVFATVIYKFIELPMMKIGKKISASIIEKHA